MADWFKVYETDLDDDCLQWAMTEQPCTGIVYFAILTKCCKAKTGTISWSKDHELFALSQKVHAGVGLVNDALSLLQRIEFIRIENGSLTVVRWDVMQSDYCRKKDVCPTKSDKVQKSPTLSVQRRGEERRLKEGSRKALNEESRGGGSGPLPGEALFCKTGEMPHEYQ